MVCGKMIKPMAKEFTAI
jgi:hypothetical protein